MQDLELRSRIVDGLMANGAKFGFTKPGAGGRRSERYTRVSGHKGPLLEWAEGEPPEAEAVERVVRRKLEEVWKHVDALGEEIRRLLGLDTASFPTTAGTP